MIAAADAKRQMAPYFWSIPKRMRVGRPDRLEVRIGDTGVAEDHLRAGLKGRGIPEIDKLEGLQAAVRRARARHVD